MKKYQKLFVITALAFGAVYVAACNSAGKNENTVTVNSAETKNTDPNEPVKITVSTNYEPKSVTVKKGQPVKLAFFRKDEKNCGDELVFPKLGIRKKLPVGETVVVELPPQEAGEISFTCGMDMMRGKILVE